MWHYRRMLRIAGWVSGVLFVVLGIYFECIVLWALSHNPRNSAEEISFAVYALVPLVYGINVIWRLNVPAKKSNPQTPEDVELTAIIQRLKSNEIQSTPATELKPEIDHENRHAIVRREPE